MSSGGDTETQTSFPPGGPEGTRIGPYRLVRPLGEGGMGAVYQAQQLEPVRRDVAIKLIKPGMDSRQVIARFESERQALAMMDHPHIAQVFDGGTTAAGLPYFVMELVRGGADYPLLPEEQAGAAGAVGAFDPGMPGDPTCAPEGDHSSGYQAFEHPGGGARWPGVPESDRLRAGQGTFECAVRAVADDASGDRCGDAAVYESGASGLGCAGRRHTKRRLLAGGSAVRTGDGIDAVDARIDEQAVVHGVAGSGAARGSGAAERARTDEPGTLGRGAGLDCPEGA